MSHVLCLSCLISFFFCDGEVRLKMNHLNYHRAVLLEMKSLESELEVRIEVKWQQVK